MNSDLSGKVCLVTGATDGHGKAVAHALAARGAELIIHGRSPEKVRSVQSEIAKANDGKAPETLLADFSSGAEIDGAAQAYLATGRPLHLLVNNAGLVGLSRRTNEEGIELTLAVNYLAQFRLTLGLLPILIESGPARIVNISSDTYRVASLHLDDLQLENDYGLLKAYGQSKLAILYFTIELAKRIEGQGVTVNAVDPGPISSNIGADNPGFAYRLARPMIRYLFPSAARAARTAMHVATSPELAEISGGYFRSMKQRKKPLDFDSESSLRLWQESLKLCGMDKDPLG